MSNRNREDFTVAKKVSSGKRKAAQKAKTTRSKATTGRTAKSASVKAVKTVKTVKAVKTASKRTIARPNASKRLTKSPLSRTELTGFRRMLLKKRQSIVGDMNGIEAEALRTRQESSGDLSTMPTHPADIGTDNYEHEFSLGLLESERALLAEINDALARIDEKTYGICMGTGGEIGKARLKARPWARYCIEHARKIEKGLVRPNVEIEALGGEDDDIGPGGKKASRKKA